MIRNSFISLAHNGIEELDSEIENCAFNPERLFVDLTGELVSALTCGITLINT